MTAAFFIILLLVWVFFSAWRFYKEVNWSEPVGATVDLAELRKKEAELGFLQDLIHDAYEKGKISKPSFDEIERFCELEIEAVRAASQPKKR